MREETAGLAEDGVGGAFGACDVGFVGIWLGGEFVEDVGFVVADEFGVEEASADAGEIGFAGGALEQPAEAVDVVGDGGGRGTFGGFFVGGNDGFEIGEFTFAAGVGEIFPALFFEGFDDGFGVGFGVALVGGVEGSFDAVAVFLEVNIPGCCG